MEDLIDRQAAINVVAQYFKAIKLNGDICIDGLKMLPLAQPTVDAELVRHGRWIDEGYYADYTNVQAWHCSECNCHVVGYTNDLFDYCPGCGAKMDEEKENAKDSK